MGSWGSKSADEESGNKPADDSQPADSPPTANQSLTDEQRGGKSKNKKKQGKCKGKGKGKGKGKKK